MASAPVASVLDASPFPYHRPLARQLHTTLTAIAPAAKAAAFLATAAQVNAAFINWDQAAAFVWTEVLDYAAAHGLTRELVQRAHDSLHPNSPHRPFLRQLLDDQSPPVEAEPRAADGAPAFLADTDAVTEPEALLYFDDLTLQIGKLPALIATLGRLVELAPSVCKLTVDVAGAAQYGTAFRIAEGQLLTNWHVVHSPAGTRAGVITAEFGYEDDGAGGVRAATHVPCDPATLVADRADDWAVVRPAQPLDAQWPIIPLAGAAEPAINAPAYIIQHPGGQRKRVAFVRNQVSGFDDRVVHYLTDTEGGSSGSPVLDGRGRLIALHHAGGRPQEVLGRPPVKKNEGIRIPRIALALGLR